MYYRGDRCPFGKPAFPAPERARMSCHDGCRHTDAWYLDVGEDIAGDRVADKG